MHRRTRPRPPWQGESTGNSFFGGTGWLFADLMVALTMVFLVATTVGFPALTKPAGAHRSAHHKSQALKKPEPALELHPVTVPINLDYNGLLSNSQGAVNSVLKSVLDDPRLKSREAGLILLFGGAGPDDSNEGTALEIDSKVQAILSSLNKKSVLFQVAVYRPFLNPHEEPSSFHMDIYLFKTS